MTLMKPPIAASKFLQQTLGEVTQITPLVGGANSRVYRVQKDGEKYCLKCYPMNDFSELCRFQRDVKFSQFIWAHQAPDVPEVIFADDEAGCVLFRYVEGEPFSGAVTEKDVNEAIRFVESINQPFQLEHLQQYEFASDAAFTLADFFSRVKLRLQQFQGVMANDPALSEFIVKSVEPALLALTASAEGMNLFSPLTPEILSPSDFGFHNAIITSKGLIFHDFEHAGRDSAWKLLADFFSQPKYPVPLTYLTNFRKNRWFSFLNDQEAEFLLVFQLTQLKWCLIILGVFLPDVAKRRLYVEQDLDLTQYQAQKLVEAIHYFSGITSRIETLSAVLELKNGEKS